MYWCKIEDGIGENTIMRLHQDPKQALKRAVAQYEYDLDTINKKHGYRVALCKESINE